MTSKRWVSNETVYAADLNALAVIADGALQSGDALANYLTSAGAGTGAAPTIGTAGSGTHVNLRLVPKGNGWTWADRLILSSSGQTPDTSDTYARLSIAAPVSAVTTNRKLVRIGGNFFGSSLSSAFTGHVFGVALDSDSVTFSNPSLSCTPIYFGSNMFANWSGGRTLHQTFLEITGAGTAGVGSYHTSGGSEIRARADLGGGPGTERGDIFSRNEIARVMDGAGPHVNSVFGEEFDIAVEGNARVLWKAGAKIVQLGTDANRGIITDYAFGINNVAGGTAPGWLDGIQLGGVEGWWPFTTGSHIMRAVPGIVGGPSMAAAAGINLRGVTFGIGPFLADGFRVDNSGNLGALVSSGVSLQTRGEVVAKTATVASITVLDGGLYVAPVTITLSAPQGSGSTATASVGTYSIQHSFSIGNNGVNYAVGDTFTVSGGTRTVAATGIVTKVNGSGGVTGFRITNGGTNSYSALPTSPVSTTTSGSGTGFTFTPAVSILTVTVTGAGSNYSEFLPPIATVTGGVFYRAATFRINMTATQGELLLNSGNRVVIPTSVTPASAAASGTQGTIAWDANYIYVCTGTNTWKRAGLSSW